MPNPSDRTVEERIRQEHEELRELLGKVHRTLARRPHSPTDVLKMLQSLYCQLQLHFDEEEVGGLFVEICSLAPRLSERAEALRVEHAWLNNRLLELIQCADSGCASDCANSDSNCDDERLTLEAKFHEFSKELMQHERKENELLMEAYGDDIGASD